MGGNESFRCRLSKPEERMTLDVDALALGIGNLYLTVYRIKGEKLL